MDNELGVNIEELLRTLKRKGIPLPWEIGTFVTLEACEAVLQAPSALTQADVWVDDQGQVAVTAKPASSPEGAACGALVVLLGDLLIGSAPGVPANLLELVELEPDQADWTLAGLRDELEASLVPLNRGATKRVIGRLLREARREGDRASLQADQEQADAGAQALDELLGVQPGEVPEGLPDASTEVEGTATAGEPQPSRETPRRSERPGLRAQTEDLIGHEQAAEGGASARILIPVLVAVVAAVVAYLILLRG